MFTFVFQAAVYFLTKAVFHTTISSTGYDDVDFYSSAGAFYNYGMSAAPFLAPLLAAWIVRDRPVSSYFSSMGGWRWKPFLKTLAVGFVIFGVPLSVRFLLNGQAVDIRFTVGGFFIMLLLVPFQCVEEELLYRSLIMQTVSSWFKFPIAGLIVQAIVFAAVHPYNLTGVIYIAATAVIYGLLCLVTRGIEASSALHILNNVIGFSLAGFGFGTITAEQTASSPLFNLS